MAVRCLVLDGRVSRVILVFVAWPSQISEQYESILVQPRFEQWKKLTGSHGTCRGIDTVENDEA